jgi:multiple sugar transport system substrate-binding protein
LAMTPAGGFWAGGLHNAGMQPDAYDVQFFPRWKSQRHQFGAAGYVIFQQAKNKDLAWEFMKHSVSKEVMELFFEGNPSTPTRRSMMTAERYATTGPKNWKVFYDTLDRFPDTGPIPAPPESNPMTTIYTRYTGLAVTGEMQPQAALDAMQTDLEALWAERKT